MATSKPASGDQRSKAVQALLQRSVAAGQAGDRVLALGLAKEAAAAAPDHPAPWFHLAVLLLEAGDPAARDILPRLEGFADFGRGWCRIGQALHRAGRAEAALVAFSRAAAAEPELVAAETGRAASLIALGRAEEAVALCRSAAERLSDAPDLAYWQGVGLKRLGDAVGAAAQFERATSLDTRHAEAWFALGSLRQDGNDHAGAAAAYEAALEVRPDLHEAMLNLGVARQETGQMEQALDCYARALKSRPTAFGRIAQALTAGRTGCLWFDLGALRRDLAARA